MKKAEIQKIKDKASILIGQRMVGMERWDASMECEFMPLEREHILKEQLKTRGGMFGDYSIDVYCPFRWTYLDRVVLASQDMFQPSTSILKEHGLEIREGAMVKDYDYNVCGANRFDEINKADFKAIIENTKTFIVRKITVSKFGDLTISFENGFTLEVFINVSDPENCWAFYETGELNNITIGGNVIVEEDIDITQT